MLEVHKFLTRKEISMGVEILRGKFIEIDGPDGVGKATQTNLIREVIRGVGLDVVDLSFPRYGQPSAVMVERYLAGDFGDPTIVDPRAASILFAQDREAAKGDILSWLGHNQVVVSDRYVTANMGHQGAKISDKSERINFFRWLLHAEYNVFSVPKPDLTIILWASSEILMPRIERRRAEQENESRRDGHEESLDHIRAAARIYREIPEVATTLDLPVEFIDCGNDPEETVRDRIWSTILTKFR